MFTPLTRPTLCRQPRVQISILAASPMCGEVPAVYSVTQLPKIPKINSATTFTSWKMAAIDTDPLE